MARPKPNRAENFTAGADEADHQDLPTDALLNSLLPGGPAAEPPAPPPEELTLGEVLPGLASVDEATLPGFAMSDDPIPVPQGPAAELIPPSASAMLDPAMHDDTLVTERPDGPITPADADIQTPRQARAGSVRYEGRIQVLDAFRYPGVLKDAPDWVDRNWIAFADHDDVRNIPAGPCLRVPLPSGVTAVCRVGDYVVQQEVRVALDTPGDVRIEVWPAEQFQKNFMPV